MRKIVFTMLLTCGLLMLATEGAVAAGGDGWPTLREQLAESHVPAGSALDKLIRANQDFSLLRPD